MTTLGRMYYRGDGVEQNVEEAAKRLRAAEKEQDY